jgi:hypothetical protein
MRVSLRGEPSIHREIEIASSKSLYAFAGAIVAAFDFDFDHAFGFYSGKTERSLMSADPKYELFADIGEESDAKSVKKSRVDEAFPRQGYRMVFCSITAMSGSSMWRYCASMNRLRRVANLGF